MGGRPSLPGNSIESTATTTIATNSELWILGFNKKMLILWPEHKLTYETFFLSLKYVFKKRINAIDEHVACGTTAHGIRNWT